jgi:hypothetical protein
VKSKRETKDRNRNSESLTSRGSGKKRNQQLALSLAPAGSEFKRIRTMSAMQSAQKPTRFAVIGSPIAHSKSPQIHEKFAQQTKRTLTYEAIEVLAADLATFIQAFFESGGAGLNVTLPHKEAVFALAEVCSSRAQLARAANTLSLDSEGRLRADNTDGAGLLGRSRAKPWHHS